MRNTKTFHQKCPFELSLSLSHDSKCLEVVKSKIEHIHELSSDISGEEN